MVSLCSVLLSLKKLKMKRNIILTAMLAFTVLTVYAGKQSVVKETRDVKGFTKINFGVAGNLYVNTGSEFKVVLEGEKEDLSEIITEVSQGRLVIKRENWHFNLHGKINIYVTMPEINALGVSGSGRAEVRDNIKTGKLSLSVSGSGNLYMAEIEVTDLDCGISGSGNIYTGGGSVENGSISISGSGNYDGEATKIGKAEISISGSGNCACNVTDYLKGSVSGSGNITYVGDPKIDVRVSGSGKVRSK
jgi:hypothetical protein